MNKTTTNPSEGSLFTLDELEKLTKTRTALQALLLATKIPDGWVGDCLHPISDRSDLTDTEISVERGYDSYDLAHLSEEDYGKRPQLYAVEIGDEALPLITLALKLVNGDSVEYDKYVAEHGLFKTNAHVKLLEQEGVYPAGTPNLTVYGPAVTPGYISPSFGTNPSDPMAPVDIETLEAYWKELETSGYVTVRCYLEEEDVTWYFTCPKSKLAVFVPHD